MAQCPTVCNADLRVDLMSSLQVVDTTTVTDENCNGMLFLTDDAGLNDVDDATSGPWMEAGSPRTRVVSSLAEVAEHFAVTSETYKAAATYFSNVGQRGVANYFTLGFWDRANEAAVDALDAINDCNACWTHLVVVHILTDDTVLMDDIQMDAIADWAMSNEKIGHLMSVDTDTEDSTNATNFKARLATAGVTDVMVYYTDGNCQVMTDPVTGVALTFPNGDPVVDHLGNPVIDPATGVQRISDGTDERIELVYPYTEMLAAGWAANVDFTQTGQDYSLAYKPVGGQGWVGVPVDTFTNGQVTAVTGIFTDGTINPNNNGYANVYVQTQGIRGMFRGLTVGGSYLDVLHLKLYARRRLAGAVASLFATSRKVPYDDARGRARLANAMETVVSTLQANGFLTADQQNWEQSGAYIRKGVGWVIRQDSFAAQSQTRKNQRLAPQLQVCIIPSGGVEHVPITLCTQAQPQAV